MAKGHPQPNKNSGSPMKTDHHISIAKVPGGAKVPVTGAKKSKRGTGYGW